MLPRQLCLTAPFIFIIFIFIIFSSAERELMFLSSNFAVIRSARVTRSAGVCCTSYRSRSIRVDGLWLLILAAAATQVNFNQSQVFHPWLLYRDMEQLPVLPDIIILLLILCFLNNLLLNYWIDIPYIWYSLLNNLFNLAHYTYSLRGSHTTY